MCVDPVTAALALKVAKAGVDFISTRQSAKAQDAAIRQNAAINQERMTAQVRQTNDAAREEMSERARQAMIERGRLQVIAGESGLSGWDREVNSTFYSESTDIATLESNRRNRIEQMNVEGRASTANTNNQLASVKRPSLLGTGLQIAAAGVNHQTAKELRSRTTTTVTRGVP
jgi:hypothetical protein